MRIVLWAVMRRVLPDWICGFCMCCSEFVSRVFWFKVSLGGYCKEVYHVTMFLGFTDRVGFTFGWLSLLVFYLGRFISELLGDLWLLRAMRFLRFLLYASIVGFPMMVAFLTFVGGALGLLYCYA